MGWERGRYYTRSKKVNGRVIREYVGAGRIGELASRFDELERERKKLARAEERARRAELDSLDASIDEFCDLTDSLARAALHVAGFHQHKGEWRKQRVRKP